MHKNTGGSRKDYQSNAGVKKKTAIEQQTVLLVNTRSLRGAEWLEEAQSKLKEKGVKLKLAKGFAKAQDLIKAAEAEKSSGGLLIVGGGDGTMNAVANLLAKTDTTMGVLPLGTGNAFARDLDIPTDLDKAIEIITEGDCTEVDLGICNGRYFVNVATVGITGHVAQTLTVPLKRRFGRFVYGIALIRALKKLRPFHVTIESEHGKTELNSFQLVIGNGRYHGGPMPLSPTAAITSGRLRLYVVEATTKVDLIKYALLLPTGLQGVLRTVHSEETTGGKVTISPPSSIVLDGEILPKQSVIEFGIEPMALRVMTPKGYKG